MSGAGSASPAGAVPPDVVALADYERYARDIIPAQILAYIEGGGADALTQSWNRQAFDHLKLDPRVLVDMKAASTRTTLFGAEMASPIIVAPMAYHKLVHAQGEPATALGAGAVGTWMCVSSQASTGLEEIAAGAHAPLWFQLYMQAERADTLGLVRRAEAAGYTALVVTVDAPVNGVRNREVRAGFALPAHIASVNLAGFKVPGHSAGPGESPVFRGLLDAAPGWDDIAWLRAQTRLPILLKGILNPHDARQAASLGVDGIVVSNHGGRTLDTLPASIEALPRVADAVGDGLVLLMDGGIRRGTDILKAIALGARAVMVGQPILHALAVAGPVGVAHAIGILRAELEMAMALTGRPTIGSIDGTAIWRDQATRSASSA